MVLNFMSLGILISYNSEVNFKLISDISNSKERIQINLNDCIVEIIQSISSLLVIFDMSKRYRCGL